MASEQDKIDKIYDFVCKMEDFNYDKLGDDVNANLFITAQATSYQRIRYFIDNLLER